MLKRILYSLHRILGTILSILFLVWFLSGFVMIYHTFPKVSNRDSYAQMESLKGNFLPVDSVLKDVQELPQKFVLKSFADKPIYEYSISDKNIKISADTISQSVYVLSYSDIERYASRWVQSPITKVDTLRQLDQWIPFSRYNKDFPIYKFYFEDEAKHELYISSVSGEALQFTDKNNRFWAWMGAIPHWIYFTSLRQNSQLWMDVIIWLSGFGCMMCIAGITLGIRSYIKQYKRKKKLKTPYRKFVYKWHHILGFVFGIFVFTFVFSGMMSLATVPQWIVKVNNDSIVRKLYDTPPIDINNYKFGYQKILDEYPNQVKRIEWTTFGDKPIYKIIVDNRLITLDASVNEIKPLALDETDIRNRLSYFHNDEVNISLMNEYDNYYVGRTNHLPLPVYKAIIDDTDGSTYYISPKNGNIKYYNTNTKVRRWTYQALHSFKFKYLAERPVLWNIVMWTTMTGGTIVSLSGVWLGFRYIKRKIKKLKQYICSK